MKPFVILQTRPEDIASEGEYESFLQLGSLDEDDLIRIRMDKNEFWKMNFDAISGIILPGSPLNPGSGTLPEVQDEIEKELGVLVDRAIEADFPFLSICYGTELMAVQTNTPISEKYGEKLSVVNIEMTDEGKKDKILKGAIDGFQTVTGHKYALDEIPKGSVLLASSARCPIQMLRFKNNIYTTQFHPELDTHSVEVRIRVYANHGYFHPHELENILEVTRGRDYTSTNKIVQNFIKIYQK